MTYPLKDLMTTELSSTYMHRARRHSQLLSNVPSYEPFRWFEARLRP